MRAAVLAYARERPQRAFVLFVLVHAVLWTAIPALVFTSPPNDVVEIFSWGPGLQWGYPKLPPLPAWLLEAAWLLSGGGMWPAWLLSQLALAVTFLAVFALARPMVGPFGALLAAAGLEGVAYFTVPAVEFNHNVLQMPLWALASLHFHRALTRGRSVHWLLLALWVALLVYTKYSGAILVLVFVLVALATREGRVALRTPWPWLAALLATALALPHLVWLVGSGFAPFDYALGQERAVSLGGRLRFAGGFLAAQILDHVPLFILAAVAVAPRRRRAAGPAAAETVDLPLAGASRFDRVFVASIALGPVLAATLLSLVLGIEFRSLWGAPMFAFSALALLLLTGDRLRLVRPRAATGLLFALVVATPIVYAAAIWASPFVTHKPHRVIWPAAEIGRIATGAWRQRADRPLAYIVGDYWIGGLAALYSPDRPQVLASGVPEASPWIDMADLRRRGALVVWLVRDGAGELPPVYASRFPRAEPLARQRIGWPGGLPIRPLELGLAIVPPEAAE